MTVIVGQRSSSKRIAWNAFLNLFGEVWTFVVLILVIPILVREMGEDGFGLFSLAWVLISYLLFLDIGVSRAATKFVSEHLAQSELGRSQLVVRSAIVANTVLGIAGGAIVLALSSWLGALFNIPEKFRDDSQLVFIAVAIAVPALLLQSVFRAVLMSLQRFGTINLLLALFSTAQWVLAVALAYTGFGVGQIVLSVVVVRLLSTAAFALALARIAPELLTGSKSDLATLKTLVRFGGWVTVSQILGPILVYLDRAMIAGFLSLAAVGLYTIPNEITTRLRIIPASVVSTLYPAFSERTDYKDEINNLYSASLRYLLLILVPIFCCLILLGPTMLSLWMGRDFAGAGGKVLQVMAVGAFFNCMAYIPYSLLQAAGRPDLTGKFHLLEVPIYVGLCVILIPQYGIVGAAIAGSIRYALDAFLLYSAAERLHKVTRVWDLKMWPTLLVTSFAIMASGVIYFAAATLWIRCAAATIMLVVYGFLSWRFGLGADKPAVLRLFKVIKQAA